MRDYECVYILIPALEEPAIKEKAERFSEIITSRKGTVYSVDHWGKRRLAFTIKKAHEGLYTLLRFSADNDILTELNRVFKYDDMVLRHMIVQGEKPDVPAADTTEQTSAE